MLLTDVVDGFILAICHRGVNITNILYQVFILNILRRIKNKPGKARIPICGLGFVDVSFITAWQIMLARPVTVISLLGRRRKKRIRHCEQGSF
jgi:hypothetical protein